MPLLHRLSATNIFSLLRFWPLLLALLAGPSQPLLAQTANPWIPLINRLSSEGLDKAWLTQLFASPEVSFDPQILARKVDSMIRKKFEPPKRPPSKTTLEQSSYRQFLKPWVLAWAGEFMRQYKTELLNAEKIYGVPKEVVTAILLIETKLGTYLGEYLAFEVLSSMALCSNFAYVQPYLTTLKNSQDRLDYAKESAQDKSEWAYQELRALLAYAKTNGQDPLSIPGSIYGAIGICQFMPSNIIKFGATPAPGGRIDVFSAPDAVYSVGSYLRGHGWNQNLDYEGQKNVVYQYNHSDLYVLAILTVADKLKQPH